MMTQLRVTTRVYQATHTKSLWRNNRYELFNDQKQLLFLVLYLKQGAYSSNFRFLLCLSVVFNYNNYRGVFNTRKGDKKLSTSVLMATILYEEKPTCYNKMVLLRDKFRSIFL